MKILIITRMKSPDLAVLTEALFDGSQTTGRLNLPAESITVVAKNGNDRSFRDEAVTSFITDERPDLIFVHLGFGNSTLAKVVAELVPHQEPTVEDKLSLQLAKGGVSFSSAPSQTKSDYCTTNFQQVVGALLQILATSVKTGTVPAPVKSLINFLRGFNLGESDPNNQNILLLRARTLSDSLMGMNDFLTCLGSGPSLLPAPSTIDLQTRRHSINNTLMALKLDIATLQHYPNLRSEILEDWSRDDGRRRIQGLVEDVNWICRQFNLDLTNVPFNSFEDVCLSSLNNTEDRRCIDLLALIDSIHDPIDRISTDETTTSGEST